MDKGSNAVRNMLGPWPGPYGGLPSLDRITPKLIERGVLEAIGEKRRAVEAIASGREAPTFANTVEALEDSGRKLRTAESIRALMTSTAATSEMTEVTRRLASEIAALEDEIALNDALFARIEAVHSAASSLEPPQARLVEVIRDRLKRQGAGLPADRRERLAEVNRLIAEKQAQFIRNELGEGERILWVDDEAELGDLAPDVVAVAAKLAEEHGEHGKWAFANRRAVVMPVLQTASNRGLRKKIRDMWVSRNSLGDDLDTHALVEEIVTLRGEKAKLLGFKSYAHLATASKMARTPERALEQLWAICRPAKKDAVARIVELQRLADQDGLGGPIEAHDYHYYTEHYRRQRFSFDSNAVKDHLKVENVVAAMFDAASRLHGLRFRPIDGVPVIDPSVRVFEVTRGDEPVGLLYMDLFARSGKMPGAWQQELRQAESYKGRVLPLSVMCANIEQPADGSAALMGWELANVLFHEFGHALHMLLSRTAYPSTGSIYVEWDFVELPSQLNERWLYDPDLLRRHARHHRTGEPISDALIDALIAVREDDRVVSVTLPYLAPALVDLEIFLAARGEPVRPFEIEERVYAEIGVPPAIDPVFKLTSQHHSFTDHYAGSLYSYLWADVMVAEVLEAFAEGEGLYDANVARQWRDEILSVGSTLPADQAFRNFRGRDPDPAALIRRFGLQDA